MRPSGFFFFICFVCTACCSRPDQAQTSLFFFPPAGPDNINHLPEVMTEDIGYLGIAFPPERCFELIHSDCDTTNTGVRLVSVKDAALIVQMLQTGLEEIVVRFSQWSNCLVTDPVFDLTGRVSFRSHP